MKKIICVLLLSVFCMVGCSKDNEPKIKETSKEVEETKEAKEVDEAEEAEEAEEVDELEETKEGIIEEGSELDSGYNENLEPVSLGMLNVAEFGVNSFGEDIVTSMGEPDDMGYYLGGLYLRYGTVTYLTSGFIADNNEVDYGQVTFVCYVGNATVLGINTGMMKEECIAILGVPNETIAFSEQLEESELYGQSWVATYYIGEYALDLLFENEDSGLIEVIVRSAY